VGAPADSLGPPAAEPSVVGNISVVGNAATDSARIIRSFEVFPGTRFSQEAVQRGIRKLFALGLFDDAWVDRLEHEGRVDLIIHVVERPRISWIHFEGNQKRQTDDLEKKLFLKVGEAYSPTAVQTQVDTLVRYYRDEGFGRARVEARRDTTLGAGHVGLLFHVSEGERVRITKIQFRGATAFPAKKLRKQLATKARGFFGGGEIKDDTFTEDTEKLTEWYRDHGYRDARVVSHELLPGRKPRDLTLAFTVEEGAVYHFGAVSWSGNTLVPSTTLDRFWARKGADLYDQSKIQRVQGLAYGEYAELGYLYVNVEPRETVTDHRVDVAYAVTEGSPSRVRMIKITGNHATREKVIRREIDIHEGDRFKRSLLVRSQGDIFRLGFFEDVQLDFIPAESTDVDIALRVKEKQVGTASAGAGYTAESGLTGFIELGHNNVLGNGQSLSLHLERGANTSNYFLSFTEPWFRDTPTLLGASAFNTNTLRDLYDEQRRGASVRIGRPLPWPDYSRGSVSYSLEDVTIRIDKP
jgi:outer membrane protein insertion porin family